MGETARPVVWATAVTRGATWVGNLRQLAPETQRVILHGSVGDSEPACER